MPDPEALAVALLRLSEHAEKLSTLDTREAARAAETGERITALTTLANAMKGTLDDQAEILAGLKGLDEQVAELASRLDEIAPGEDGEARAYQPPPPRRSRKAATPAPGARIARHPP